MMRTRVFDAHHRYLSEEIWSCGQDLFETPVASIQSGEHLHFEDRDEVGWLGPSRSLRMMKKSEREERSGTEPPVLHTHDPPILPSLPLSHPHSAGILDCFPRLFIAPPSYSARRSSLFGDTHFVGEGRRR